MTIVRETDRDVWGRVFICRCVCGKEVTVKFSNLTSGNSKSCGCRRGESHGEGNHRHGHMTTEYKIWCRMKDRCLNPKDAAYENYGGRGIAVCERWRLSFTAFLADVGRRPSKKYSLDRIDNDKGYEPGNVRWATRQEQAKNSRHVRLVTVNGETMCVEDWSRRTGVSSRAIVKRLNKGMSPKDAVSLPSKAVNGGIREVTADGVTRRLHEWARDLGATPEAIAARLRNGWSPEMAVSVPVRAKKTTP